jgi:hypothetical protein
VTEKKGRAARGVPARCERKITARPTSGYQVGACMWLRVAQDEVKEDKGRDPLLGPGPHLLPIALLPFVGCSSSMGKVLCCVSYNNQTHPHRERRTDGRAILSVP